MAATAMWSVHCSQAQLPSAHRLHCDGDSTPSMERAEAERMAREDGWEVSYYARGENLCPACRARLRRAE